MLKFQKKKKKERNWNKIFLLILLIIGEAGYYLYDSGLKVKGEDTGTFYVCDGNKQGPCSTTIPSVGYFINAAYDATQAAADSTNHNAQYIKCSGITNPTDCTAYNAAGGSCTADGLVYSNGGHVYLCLDATRTVSVQLDGSDEEDTDYFIYANDASNIFGPSNDKYIFVNVNAGNVTPSETGNYFLNLLKKILNII